MVSGYKTQVKAVDPSEPLQRSEASCKAALRGEGNIAQARLGLDEARLQLTSRFLVFVPFWVSEDHIQEAV